MEILKSKNGIKYRESITIGTKRIKSPSFNRKTDATQWKAKKLIEREKIKLYGLEFKKVEKRKISEFANYWIETKIKPQRSQGTYSEYNRMINKNIIPAIGDKFLNQITKEDANKLIRKLKDNGHVDSGVNKILTLFKQVMLEAEKDELILKSPLRNVKGLKEVKRPPKYWQKSEIRNFLLKNKDSYLYDFWLVALNTGMRKGELCALCWDKIDFDKNLIEVSRILDRYGLRNTTKSGAVRFVPMNSAVRECLLKIPQNRLNDFVFIRKDGSPIPFNHVYREFRKACEKVTGLPKIRFHDLRHTFASQYMMHGGNAYDLQSILGHHDFKQTQKYAHLSPTHLSRATEILSFHGEIKDMRPELAQSFKENVLAFSKYEGSI